MPNFSAVVKLSALAGTNGFRISGEARGDYGGRSVSSAGDVNGDGVVDLIVGAEGVDLNGNNSGASYVIFGIPADLTINGTRGPDELRGRSGDDAISGSNGDDRLFGEGGDDTLTGGRGRDVLFGGAGADSFMFRSLAESPQGTVFDTIRDFSQADGDLIDLGAFNGTLSFREDQGFSGTAREVFFRQSASNTFVFVDQNGDRRADFKLALDGVINLTAGDFVL